MIGVPSSDTDLIADESVEVDQNPIAISTVVDSDISITKFKKFISGYSWNVESYFNKQTAENDINTTVDIETPEALQQYIEIKNFELKVTNPIDNVKPNDVEGEAVITDILPQEGDLFFARLINGILGCFTITSVEHGLYNFRNIYTVKFKLTFVKTLITTPLFDDIKNKVISTKSYDTEAFYDNSTPIVEEDILTFRKEADNYCRSLEDYYLNKFYNSNVEFLTVPDDYNIIIDPYLTMFLFYIFDRSHPVMDRLRNYNDLNYNLYNTPYHYIFKKDKAVKSFIKSKREVVSVNGYSNDPYMQSLIYTGANIVVEYLDDSNFKPIEGNIDTLYPNQNVEYNLFSKSFYEDGNELSLLEELLTEFINRSNIDYKKVLTLVNSIRDRNNLEQFYYIPFIYMLIKYAKVNSYSLENTYAR